MQLALHTKLASGRQAYHTYYQILASAQKVGAGAVHANVEPSTGKLH